MKRKDVKDILNRIKTTTGCLICGYSSDPKKLHYHHKRDIRKDFNVAHFRCSQIGDINALFDEIDKCVLLCSVCHNIWEQSLIRGKVY